MSYARWTSVCENNFESDLYLYWASSGGIVVDIADRRVVDIEKRPTWADLEPVERYAARSRWYDENWTTLVRKRIDLPYAGTSHVKQSVAELITFCTELKALGFNMPDRILLPETYADFAEANPEEEESE